MDFSPPPVLQVWKFGAATEVSDEDDIICDDEHCEDDLNDTILLKSAKCPPQSDDDDNEVIYDDQCEDDLDDTILLSSPACPPQIVFSGDDEYDHNEEVGVGDEADNQLTLSSKPAEHDDEETEDPFKDDYPKLAGNDLVTCAASLTLVDIDSFQYPVSVSPSQSGGKRARSSDPNRQSPGASPQKKICTGELQNTHYEYALI